MSGDDAVVVGSGPNGLAGALTLARAGLKVRVIERSAMLGGGARSSALTLPGFIHDECSAVHPQAFASPFFRQIGLERKVDFVVPPVSYAHPFDGAGPGLLLPDVAITAAALPTEDRRRWSALFGRLHRRIDAVTDLTMSPMLRAATLGPTGMLYAAEVFRETLHPLLLSLTSPHARALILGSAAHLATSLPSFAATAGGLALTLQGQVRGWPLPVGGSGSIVSALVDELVQHGVVFETGREVVSLGELGAAPIVLLDIGVRAFAKMAPGLPARYARRLRSFRYGPGVLKVDYALTSPVPWRDRSLALAGTVHVGGDPASIIAAERAALAGKLPTHPFVIVSQPSLFDPTRAPQGRHTLWAYCHVPAGWSDPAAGALVDAQIERFAPGFRDTILARVVRTAHQLEMHNPNCVGGDFTGGQPTLGQLVRRPIAFTPWRTPLQGVYLASSSTSPGPGVHGMSGHLAARQALKDLHLQHTVTKDGGS